MTREDKAYCWGENRAGQLGLGTAVSLTSSPDPVAGGLSFKSVHAGQRFTCGVDTAGALYCWGQGYGQAPKRLSPELQFASVDAGVEHACAVTVAGQAYCWGRNFYGQLGNGTTSNSAQPQTQPQPVQGKILFRSVSAAGHTAVAYRSFANGHSCGISMDHRVYCWGDNQFGKLGNGGTTLSTVPVAVADPVRS